MQRILVATKNPYKKKKLLDIVSSFYEPETKDDLQEIIEKGDSFLEVAEHKAKEYSKLYNCLAIATDGGAVISALKGEWNPVMTKRFADTDKERIEKLLKMMEDKKDRTEEWYEALAVADKGEIIFSAEAKAIDGIIDKEFNPKFYQEGIWFCSITSFPKFGGKNFFELTDEEKLATENSWDELKICFKQFFGNKKPL